MNHPPSSASSSSPAHRRTPLTPQQHDEKHRQKQARIQRLLELRQTTLSNYVPPFGYDACELRVLIHNQQSKNNIGQLLRSCVAMGVGMIYIVDRHETKHQRLRTFGHHNTMQYLTFLYFHSIDECIDHIRASGFKLYGIEIDDDSVSVLDGIRYKDRMNHINSPTSISISTSLSQSRSSLTNYRNPNNLWYRKTVLLAGNEASGLLSQMKSLCDKLIYIPQYSTSTASLNVTVAMSIVMHRFAEYAGWNEASREGGKYKSQLPTDNRSSDITSLENENQNENGLIHENDKQDGDKSDR